MPAVSPMRGTALVAPPGLRFPPRRLWRGGRPLKAWRYTGLYTENLMLCAGRVRIGGVPQQFWAVWDRGRTGLRERTSFGGRSLRLDDDRITLHDRRRQVRIDLALEPYGEGVEVCSPHGRSYIWTRKWLARASGEISIAGAVHPVTAPVLVDDSAGYHARETRWDWCAGTGTGAEGAELAWNLVSGIHDDPAVSERTLWVNGRAREVGPVGFGGDLASVSFAGGHQLQFRAEATRERHDNLGIVRSDYVQPFGAFSGVLPDGTRLATGQGVMERHSARW